MWDFKVDSVVEELLTEIKYHLVSVFEISNTEAIEKINDYWKHRDSIIEDDIIFHENSSYWANTVFFGKGSGWWLNDKELEDHLNELEQLGFEVKGYRQLFKKYRNRINRIKKRYTPYE